MKLNRVATALSGIAVAGVAVTSGLGMTHHTATSPATRTVAAADLLTNSTYHPARQTTAARPSSSADAAAAWLESPGGQAQVTFNDDVATLANDLYIENDAPTVHNHLVFEADARVVRADAQKILSTPTLLPTTNRAAYQHMLTDFITVANLLQPGSGYGTTPQDWAAWNTAMNASNITVY
jgi:hypothetical protein